MTCEGGLGFLIDLPHAAIMRSGDALALDDGRHIEIAAAAEPLAEIIPGTPLEFIRMAYHLGNRHLPAEILDGSIRICSDRIIEKMAQRLGARVQRIEAPFEPETAGRSHE